MTDKHKEDKLGTVGAVGRFRPLHNGAALMLEILCQQADHVKIGIGSSNKYNVRNPFTAQETQDMIHTFLAPRYTNYTFYNIPDVPVVPKEGENTWEQNLFDSFGSLDHFVTGNPYVKELLEKTYNIIDPVDLIPKEQQLEIHGTKVRLEMAQNGPWQNLVPKPVAQYLIQHHLINRFQQEFGVQTHSHTHSNCITTENREQEYQHMVEEQV